MQDPVLLLAFGFGSGLAKKMPGTMGTLATIPIYLLLIQLGDVFYVVFTLLSIISGIWICQIAADKLNEHDYSGIVWDEVAGFLLTMLWIPYSPQALVYGFILFRLFDIVKPWPIKWADRKVEGGLGIMLDDLLAAGFAALILHFML